MENADLSFKSQFLKLTEISLNMWLQYETTL